MNPTDDEGVFAQSKFYRIIARREKVKRERAKICQCISAFLVEISFSGIRNTQFKIKARYYHVFTKQRKGSVLFVHENIKQIFFLGEFLNFYKIQIGCNPKNNPKMQTPFGTNMEKRLQYTHE